MVDALDL